MLWKQLELLSFASGRARSRLGGIRDLMGPDCDKRIETEYVMKRQESPRPVSDSKLGYASTIPGNTVGLFRSVQHGVKQRHGVAQNILRTRRNVWTPWHFATRPLHLLCLGRPKADKATGRQTRGLIALAKKRRRSASYVRRTLLT
jgi:hypothetical protein